MRGVFVFFFNLHADKQGKTCSSLQGQISFPPWPRGKGYCLPTCSHRLTLILGGSVTFQVQLRFGKLDLSVSDPPKTQVKAGCGVQENIRQYREAKEANVICVVFLTNI